MFYSELALTVLRQIVLMRFARDFIQGDIVKLHDHSIGSGRSVTWDRRCQREARTGRKEESIDPGKRSQQETSRKNQIHYFVTNSKIKCRMTRKRSSNLSKFSAYFQLQEIEDKILQVLSSSEVCSSISCSRLPKLFALICNFLMI